MIEKPEDDSKSTIDKVLLALICVLILLVLSLASNVGATELPDLLLEGYQWPQDITCNSIAVDGMSYNLDFALDPDTAVRVGYRWCENPDGLFILHKLNGTMIMIEKATRQVVVEYHAI